MKTNRILRVTCLLLLLVLIGKLAYNHNLWNIRGVEPSDLYRRYEHADGISAAFVKDYRVNDTLTLDVTLLQATDSAGWQQMMHDFRINPSAESLSALNKDQDVLVYLPSEYIGNKKINDNEVAVASYSYHYTCIFHCNNTASKILISDAIWDRIFYSLKNKHNFFENEKDN